MVDKCSLYIQNLSYDIKESDLSKAFCGFGRIKYVVICKDFETQDSLGYGYVNYYNEDDCKNALHSMNNKLMNNKAIRVKYSLRNEMLNKSNRANIYVSNLDRNIDVPEFKEIFSIFGVIIKCKIITDTNGVSRGYGFVQFKQDVSATRAISEYDQKMINGRRIHVAHFIAKTERHKTPKDDEKIIYTNIFIRNFSPKLTTKQLYDAFKQFGEIVHCRIIKNSEGVSRGFGFIEYKEPNSARSAVVTMNGHTINDYCLYVERAQERSERLEELQKLYGKISLYVSNFDRSFNNARLFEQFAKFHGVTSAMVKYDEDRNKVYGFVGFTCYKYAKRAMDEMDGKMIDKRQLYVSLKRRQKNSSDSEDSDFPDLTNSVENQPILSQPPYTMNFFNHKLSPFLTD